MDHLPWSKRCGTPRLQVPYLVSVEDDLQHLDESSLLQEIEQFEASEKQSLRDLATAAQTWLYFGLLKLLLGAAFHADDFVDNGFVCSTQIVSLLISHGPDMARPGGASSEASPLAYVDHYLTSVRDSFCYRVVPHTARLEKDTSRGQPTLWNSAEYRAIFSVPILIQQVEEHILGAGYLIPRAIRPDGLLLTRTAGLPQTLADSGRCPSLISKIGLLEKDFFTLISFPPHTERSLHVSCSAHHCAVSEIDEATYETRHTSACDRSTCTYQGFDREELYRVMDGDNIPLVSTRIDSTGALVMELQAGTFDSHYTAISHVWADGLGNMQANALPSCQILRLHQRMESMAKSHALPSALSSALSRFVSLQQLYKLSEPYLYKLKSESTRQLFYIDTLCVPRCTRPPHPTDNIITSIVDAENQIGETPYEKARRYRSEAIDSMSRIYAGAQNVLVLDSGLESENLEQLTDFETEIAVVCSAWMGRSWTLQEGALAPAVMFQFADGTERFSEIHKRVSCLSTSLSSFSLIETALAGLLPGSSHPERSQGISDYVFETLFDLPESESPHSRSLTLETYDLTLFSRVWNALAERQTSNPNDVAAILAALLNLSAGEVLCLTPEQGVRAILKRHRILPASILLVPNMKLNETCGWAPELPSLRSFSQMTHERSPVIKVTDSALRFDDTSTDGVTDGVTDGFWWYTTDWTDSQEPIFKRISPERILKLEILEKRDYDAPTPSVGPKVLWLSWNRDMYGRYLGRCFSNGRFERDGLHVAIGEIITWDHHTNSEVGPEADHSEEENQLTPLHELLYPAFGRVQPVVIDMGECPYHWRFGCVLLIWIDVKSWPNLEWYRTSAFPFPRFGGSFRVFTALSMVGWALPIITANFAVPLAVYFRRDTGFRMSSLWLVTLLTDAISLCRAASVVLEVRFLDNREAVWIHQIWADSFWHRGARPATLSDRPPTFILNPLLVYAVSAGVCMLALSSLGTAKFDPPWDREEIETEWWILNTVLRLSEAMFDRKWSGLFYVLFTACAFELVSRVAFLLVYLYSWYRIRSQLRERKPGGPTLQHEVWRTFAVLFCVSLLSVIVSETVAVVSLLTNPEEELVADSRRNLWILVAILIFGEIFLIVLLMRMSLVSWKRVAGPQCYRHLQRLIERYRHWREEGPGPIQLTEDT